MVILHPEQKNFILKFKCPENTIVFDGKEVFQRGTAEENQAFAVAKMLRYGNNQAIFSVFETVLKALNPATPEEIPSEKDTKTLSRMTGKEFDCSFVPRWPGFASLRFGGLSGKQSDRLLLKQPLSNLCLN